MARVLVVFVLALALTACGESSAPPPALDGSWGGAQSGVQLTLTLSNANGVVTGTGFIADVSRNVTTQVSGTYAHPDVNLTITPLGYVPVVFAGRFTSNDVIQGTLNGSGFINVAYTLSRR